jgi:hypothetical protein
MTRSSCSAKDWLERVLLSLPLASAGMDARGCLYSHWITPLGRAELYLKECFSSKIYVFYFLKSDSFLLL